MDRGVPWNCAKSGTNRCGQVSADAGSWPRNAARVRTGVFEYRDSDHGRQVGRSEITIQRFSGSGNLSFTNKAEFSGGFSGFQSQQWEAVTSPDFKPVLARLAVVKGDKPQPVFEISYHSGRVTGFIVRHRDNSIQGVRESVKTPIPAAVVDQRIDWGAILASNLERGRHIEFEVFDPVTGIGDVTAEVGSSQLISVPAGTFESYAVDYQIQKLNKTEHYRLFVTITSPHMMVREDFPNGVVSELVRTSKSAPQR